MPLIVKGVHSDKSIKELKRVIAGKGLDIPEYMIKKIKPIK